MDKTYWPNVGVGIPIKDNRSTGKLCYYKKIAKSFWWPLKANRKNDCSRVLCVIPDCETRWASVLLVGKKGQSDNVWSLWKFMVKRIT